jgi:hypothetical protein
MKSAPISLTIVGADFSDTSMDETIAAYEGSATPPTPTLPPHLPQAFNESSGRRGAYIVTNGRHMGIFLT